MGLCETPDYEPSYRLSDEYERCTFSGLFQCGTDFERFLCKRPRRRSGIAPSEAGTVVTAHTCGIRQWFLYEGPVDGEAAAADAEDDRRSTRIACTSTQEVQAVPSEIHEVARSDRYLCRLGAGGETDPIVDHRQRDAGGR